MNPSPKGVKQSQGSLSLESFANQYMNETAPVRSQVFNQISEALATGGIGARIPIIQRAVSDSRAATSAAMQGVNESLARTGLSSSSFGQRIRAETSLAGEQATARIPTDIAKEFISVAPSLATGSAAQVMSGFGNAGQLEIQAQQVAAQRQAAQLQALTGLITSLASFGNLAGKRFAQSGMNIAM